MGTDFVHLMDRRLAEIIVKGTEDDLIAIVDLRTKLLINPRVWRHYWDATRATFCDFDQTAHSSERLRLKLMGGASLPKVKSELVSQLCTGDSLHLDYWGRTVEVFGGEPTGGTTFEDFIAPMYDGQIPNRTVHRHEDGSSSGPKARAAFF